MSNKSGIIGDIIHGNIGRNGITTSETTGARITAIIVGHAGIRIAITGTTPGAIITDTTIIVGHA